MIKTLLWAQAGRPASSANSNAQLTQTTIRGVIARPLRRLVYTRAAHPNIPAPTPVEVERA